MQLLYNIKYSYVSSQRRNLLMKYFIALLLCLANTVNLCAQQRYLIGSARDYITNVPPVNGVVTLFSVTDSLLVSFTRIRPDGTYSIKKPKEGRYFIMVSHPNFADYIDTLIVAKNATTVATVFLTSKKKIIQDIVIKSRTAPVTIKGDTVVYTADSFRVRNGANVEELLRKLPGLQVNRNGEIKAMGEKVKKILVDGEEFFGTDPGVAIKNLQANAVDKVEVFDKKTDQAAFTGIDDGVSEKTINLKLKSNKKNGYFGKLEASGGRAGGVPTSISASVPDHYDMQGMINAFKAKRKLAAFATTGNIGNTTLGWEDGQKFSGSTNLSLTEESQPEFGDNDDFTNFYGGTNGIPKNWNAGAHYSNKFNNGKTSINVHYRYNKINAVALNNTYATTFLPDSIWNNNSGSTSRNSKERHVIGMIYETKLDSNNIIKLSLGATNKQANVLTQSFSNALVNTAPTNGNKRTMVGENEGNNYSGNALWLHKFKKKNRTFSWGIGAMLDKSESEGMLNSLNQFYTNGVLNGRDSIDQQKRTLLDNQQLYSKLSYTEPLSKKLTAELSLHTTMGNIDNNRQSLEKDADGKYSKLAVLFSNHFKLNTIAQTPGFFFKYAHKKVTLNIGTKAAFTQFTQENISNNNKYDYDFINHFPSISFSKKLKGNSSIRASVEGSGIAPSFEQLQPIQDNTNPLFIVTGNPDLKSYFESGFSLGYDKYNVISSRGVWARMRLTTINNAFTNFSTIDNLGRVVNKTVNVNGNYNGFLNFNYSFKLDKLNLGVDFGPLLTINKSNDFINGLQNESRNASYGLNIGFNKYKVDKKEETIYSIWINMNGSKNFNTTTINKDAQADFWSVAGYVNSSVRLFWKIQFECNVEIDYREKDPRFPRNNNLTLLDMSLSKEIVKNAFSISVKAFDVLKQNRGFNRNFIGTTYTETFNNVLQQYWLLNMVYKFNSQKSKMK